jgi:ABC-2 type transport system ATP-binding protein
MGLRITDLVVSFPGFELGPVTLDLPSGMLLALLGTNGSGKSTLIRSILGVEDIARGRVMWNGANLRPRTAASAAHLAYVSDSSRDLLLEFTPLEYWRYCILAYERARREPLPNALENAFLLAEELDLPWERRVPLAGLSLGTARKVQIIAALMTDPQLVILDEPFIGLDFIAARALERTLAALRQSGATVLVSNHDLDLASRLADRIVLLHRGNVLLNTAVSDLGGSGNLKGAVGTALDDFADSRRHADAALR